MVEAFKVASGDNNFFPMIDYICSTGKPLIISTGLSDLCQIHQTRDFVLSRQPKIDGGSLVLLHCVSGYPVPAEQANLQAITALQKIHPYVGYSDHTLGIEAATAAVALGARVIEKHFTVSKTFSSFRDHSLSAEPQELADLVVRVRQVNSMTSQPEKAVQDCERDNLIKARRSICASVRIEPGSRVTLEHLSFLRPGTGISPDRVGEVIGRVVRKELNPGDPFALELLE
jgi:sialic acid synthase SpsE